VILPDGPNVNHTLLKESCVLVVSKACAREYGAERVGEGSTKGKERLVV
jgi:hypothetical protein